MDKTNFTDNVICETSAFNQFSQAVDLNLCPIFISGMPNIVKADMIRAAIVNKNKKALVVVDDELQAVKFSKDLSAMGLVCYTYFYKDFNFINAKGQSKDYEYKRIYSLYKILSNDFDVIVTSVDAALQYTIPKDVLKDYSISLSVEQTVSISDLTKKLLNLGYEMFNMVENVGQFSIRGGIVDVFSPAYSEPLRIDFWGDCVDTISFFDPLLQRRSSNIETVTILPCCEVIENNKQKLISKINSCLSKSNNAKAKEIALEQIDSIKNDLPVCLDKYISLVYDNPTTLLDYFSSDNFLIFESDPAKISEKLDSFTSQVTLDTTVLFKEGVLFDGIDSFCADFHYYQNFKENNILIYMDSFLRSSYSSNIKKYIELSAITFNPWNGSLSALYDDISDFYSPDSRIVILAGNKKSAQNLVKTLNDYGFNSIYSDTTNNLTKGLITVSAGSLSSGFSYPDSNFKLITSMYEPKYEPKKKKSKDTKQIYSLSDLKNGDLVVHISHGIGIFCGIHKIKANGIEKDYIKIQYAKKDVLYIPVTQLDMVSKYIGTKDDVNVKLNSLSSPEWEKTKLRAKKAAKDIAKKLIKLYAQRLNTKGFAFSADGPLQRDFEAQFEFEETDDQLKCINDIKTDMQNPVPMDRLLCGDVGFGKTEVALRAMFKCVLDSKQCALLVPTTILAWQHYKTITRRFEKFPVRIELLSRFKSAKDKNKILEDLKRGKIDIIIGTHSLIQKNIEFKNLGLAIIDEEQRFGVEQKEKFKSLKNNIDILTLSATPIPRTLNMAMSGLRDMSSIEEAPQNRYPVQTYVIEHDIPIIVDAIKKELRRFGQVYYLHNRTSSIQQIAAILQNALPDHNVAFAHGKMSERELSIVWEKMINHQIDVLVCTTIIETGIDVPNVNTIIIDNADKMGLSQLHQLRGRVGRSNKRAYAYFTFAPNKVLSDVSEKRLNAIQEFTQFGSGFKIAMRDLEIRGAGNVLGAQQHGHMESIGYDLYIKILNEAIESEKGHLTSSSYDFESSVDLPVSAFIPDSYISDINQRLDIYKKISLIRDENEISDIIDEILDRFGEPPVPVLNLIDIAFIRSLSQQLFIYEIKCNAKELLLFPKDINSEFVGKIFESMKDKVSINASSTPFISIKTDTKKNILHTLKNILKLSI